MKKLHVATASFAVLLSVWLGMASFVPALAQQAQSLSLPSGRVLKVLGMEPTVFSKEKTTGLSIKYQSECKPEDKEGLGKEAGEVWAFFRFNVENSSYPVGLMTAVLSTKPMGTGVSGSKNVNFVVKKDASGAWHALDYPNLVEGDDLYRKMNALLQSHDFRQAIVPLNKLIALWPKSAECLNDRAGCLMVLKDYKNALPDCERAVKLAPENYLVHLNRGTVYLELHNTNLALIDFTKAISIKPDLTTAYVNRGAVYKELHKPDLALDDLNKAISIDPNLSSALSNRGEIYFKTKKFTEAVRDCSAALKTNPKGGEAYFFRGKSYKALGDTKAAEADFAQAKALGYKEGEDTLFVVK